MRDVLASGVALLLEDNDLVAHDFVLDGEDGEPRELVLETLASVGERGLLHHELSTLLLELVESVVDGVDLAVALVDVRLERRDLARSVRNGLLSCFDIGLERADDLGQDEARGFVVAHERSQLVALRRQLFPQSVALGLQRDVGLAVASVLLQHVVEALVVVVALAGLTRATRCHCGQVGLARSQLFTVGSTHISFQTHKKIQYIIL